MRGLNGKRVIVTGGSSGIGRAAALRLAEEGCVVGIFDLNEAGAQETVSLVPEGAPAMSVHVVDIGDYAAVESAVARFEAAAGPTDLLANVAGWDKAALFLESTPDLWDKIIRINTYGTLNLHHVIVRGMVERGFGRVVNVSSDSGRIGTYRAAVYSGCKGGMIAFTKALAREVARKGVNLNTVCPGPTDTPLFQALAGDRPEGVSGVAEAFRKSVPLRRIAVPDDYPGLIAFLLSDDAAFMTGQTISVSGGITMI